MELQYDIVTAKTEDIDRIADFLIQSFYPNEPLNEFLSIPSERSSSEMFSLQFIPQGASFLAISRIDGHILGVCINAKERINEEPPKKLTFTYEDSRKIGSLIEKLEETADVWKTTGADSAWSVIILAVGTANRGRGMGRVLMEHTREKARAEGTQMIYVVCTSYFSAKIARNMGMQSVHSILYSEYKDKDGQPVFKPPHPHTEIALFVQKLAP